MAKQLVQTMIREGIDEVQDAAIPCEFISYIITLQIVLEAEVGNEAALSLYGKLGFVRDKRLAKYYLNGSDAFRLKLWIT